MVIGLPLLTTLILLGTLGYVLWRGPPAAATAQPGVLARIWTSLNLVRRNWETDTTFRLLVALMLVFVAALVVWAMGAAVMRTVWLYQDVKEGSRWLGDSAPLSVKFLLNSGLFVLMQIVRGVGGILALCLAGVFSGAVLGFLFGHPKQQDADKTPPAQQAPQVTASAWEKSQRWKLNTSLTDILEWLTKMIVGIGLVEAKGALTWFAGITAVAADWLFGSRHGSPAVVAAAIGGGAVFGFLFTYLYTLLFITRLIAETDAFLRLPGHVAQKIRGIRAKSQGIAPRISRSDGPHGSETSDHPSLDEVEAALQYNAITFNDLISRPGITQDDVWNWARAKAILNNYPEAAKGYVHLLGMKDP